ncbi:glycogen synthase GlgA [Myxococcota bacterium]|nr:glycogen synthase GlgA [Myxococcota bacterium]MBU1379893.1 glycogen synthase GlgA [Myxococcota bacterium]MBU1498778.1 glycogen synthase GlgA [Myxococcota bacterium]
MKHLKILFVSSEVRPFAMTGGLGDVSGSLPRFLQMRGHDVRIVMPGYSITQSWKYRKTDVPLGVPLGHGDERWCGVRISSLPGSDVPIFFLEHDSLYGRSGLYGDSSGEFGDNLLRFSLLSRGSLQLCHYLGWYPDVVHVNDWQTAMVPGFLNSVEAHSPLGRAASLLTIHNLGYQGRFWSDPFDITGLPWDLFTHLGFEYFNGINLLKGGIYHSTLINTVSNTYAHEIQTPEMGEGLDGILRERGASLYGILNGIDTNEWDPATDRYLENHFNADDLRGKSAAKRSLQMELGLELRDDVPIISMVTRLAWQKGIDVVAGAIRRIMELDVQFVLVGTGEGWAEHFFGSLNSEYPGRIRCVIDFNTGLSHRVEAGSDLFLMPSRYEPCGLNQIYSLRYGTLPIVRATGGLADTVQNYDEENGSGTGFKFYDLNEGSLFDVTAWAVNTWRHRPDHFRAMIKRAMSGDYSWDKAAAQYEELYHRAVWIRARQ